MRKLIEKRQSCLVVCDNPNCDFTYPYNLNENPDLKRFINVMCPRCGENLLTMKDYIAHENLIRTVDWINKWFSWVTIFYSKERLKNKQVFSVHVHEGIKIENINK